MPAISSEPKLGSRTAARTTTNQFFRAEDGEEFVIVIEDFCVCSALSSSGVVKLSQDHSDLLHISR